MPATPLQDRYSWETVTMADGRPILEARDEVQCRTLIRHPEVPGIVILEDELRAQLPGHAIGFLRSLVARGWTSTAGEAIGALRATVSEQRDQRNAERAAAADAYDRGRRDALDGLLESVAGERFAGRAQEPCGRCGMTAVGREEGRPYCCLGCGQTRSLDELTEPTDG